MLEERSVHTRMSEFEMEAYRCSEVEKKGCLKIEEVYTFVPFVRI